MRLQFHPEAVAEYEDEVAYYQARQAGLGDRFVVAVQAALESVREEPGRWPILEEDVRRRLVRVFPFSLLYTIEVDFILVIAVMHCHRDPGYWKHRVVNS